MDESSGLPAAERYRMAASLYDKGGRRQVVKLGQELVYEGYQPAYLLLGLAYEFGGDGIETDLGRAADYYRRLAFGMPSDIPYLYLARIYLKKGRQEDLAKVRSYLAEASGFRRSGALYLAKGAYHESRSEWLPAARCNGLAGLYGRLLGMRRAADALSKAGYQPIAWLLRFIQLVVGLPLRVLIGRRSIEDF